MVYALVSEASGAILKGSSPFVRTIIASLAQLAEQLNRRNATLDSDVQRKTSLIAGTSLGTISSEASKEERSTTIRKE